MEERRTRKIKLALCSPRPRVSLIIACLQDHVRILPLRDDLAMPAMALCGVLLAMLVTVAGVYVYRHRAEVSMR